MIYQAKIRNTFMVDNLFKSPSLPESTLARSTVLPAANFFWKVFLIIKDMTGMI